MELFSISIDTRSDHEKEAFRRILSDKQKELHKRCKQLKFAFSAAEARVTWTCSGKLPLSTWTLSAEELRRLISEAVTAYIMEEREQELAARLLYSEFEFDDEEEAERILQCYFQLLSNEGEAAQYWQSRRRKLVEGIDQCLLEGPELNLNGFLTFRLHTYEQELRDLAEYAVDEFILDQQYEEFVSLLKYFVYFQEPKMPIVHVIHKGEEDFLLLDGNLRPIERPQEDGLIIERLDQEMEIEDMIVSTLIAVSPARMIIHTRNPDLPVIMTLAQIFDNRAQICCSCPECSVFLGSGRMMT
ncbi:MULTISPECIES: putative sporulation protein YtxC [Paenibacillus]|uniref:Sporulation protein n=1 Tax=Paenibacillus campinasensis TaxID=66347 RepID=A0A268EP72_9BACL|nr:MULTISPECIES: putative sporulation protein YtxC [Paenibacillus]MUG66091.1 sporulation protein [Paenibacillus campinasensis]PAD74927.1 sporulation protein [Paenibacillus campinasensis]PAK50052.1 sporulation protein [Paenibacillus sp. 7541]